MGLFRMTIRELKTERHFGRFAWPLCQPYLKTRRRVELRGLVYAMVMLCLSSISWAADPPTIRLCQDSEDVYPWTLSSRPGLNNILLKIVEAKVGVEFTVTSLPWKRCQEEMKFGNVDGMFAISFLPERLEFSVYPMHGNEPDMSKSLMTDGYSLYRRRGDDNVKWNGKEISVNGLIGVQRGYSAIVQLQKLNAKVDAASSSIEDNMRKLMAGRVAALALRTNEGDSILAFRREYGGKIEKMQMPLVEKPYYLVFSKGFAAARDKQMRDIWESIESVRSSPEYKVIETSFR